MQSLQLLYVNYDLLEAESPNESHNKGWSLICYWTRTLGKKLNYMYYDNESLFNLRKKSIYSGVCCTTICNSKQYCFFKS